MHVQGKRRPKLGLPWGVQEKGRGEKLQVRMRAVRARSRGAEGKASRGVPWEDPRQALTPRRAGWGVGFQGSLGLNRQLFLPEGGEGV